MGNQASSETPRSPARRGLQLQGHDKNCFEEMWRSACGDESDRMTCEQFTKTYSSMVDAQVSKSVFIYLSLNNDSIEKEFMENRLYDLIAHDATPRSFSVAPWKTLIDVVGLSPQAIVSLAARAPDFSHIATEASSIEDLITQFPNIEYHFNRSVVQFVLHFSSWSQPLNRPASDILSNLHFRIIGLLIQGECDLLFSTARHGSSFRSLAPAIRYYPGALLVVIKDTNGRIFGFFSERTNWTETGDRFDEDARSTFLFQLEPEIRLRRINARGSSNCIYFNASNQNHPVGIGLGGRPGNFRLWIDGNDVSIIKSMDVDATFEPGQLVSGESESSVIEAKGKVMEIFGFGGPSAIEEQSARRAADQELRMDRRKVDRMKLVQNEFDREMLFSKTFKQNAQTDRLGS